MAKAKSLSDITWAGGIPTFPKKSASKDEMFAIEVVETLGRELFDFDTLMTEIEKLSVKESEEVKKAAVEFYTEYSESLSEVQDGNKKNFQKAMKKFEAAATKLTAAFFVFKGALKGYPYMGETERAALDTRIASACKAGKSEKFMGYVLASGMFFWIVDALFVMAVSGKLRDIHKAFVFEQAGAILMVMALRLGTTIKTLSPKGKAKKKKA